MEKTAEAKAMAHLAGSSGTGYTTTFRPELAILESHLPLVGDPWSNPL